MSPRRKRLLLTLAISSIALSTVLAALHHWWYWHRYTDFANLVERSRIALPKYIGDAALSPDGGTMYVLHEPERGRGHVRIFDTATDTQVGSIALEPGFPVSMDITPDGAQLLVAVSSYRGGSNGGTMGRNRVDVIDTAARAVSGTIPVDGRCAGFVAVTPDGKSAYVSERTSIFLDHLDLTSNRVVSKIRVPGGPFTVVPKKHTDLVYVVSVRSGKRTFVSVVDTETDTVVATVDTDLKRDVQPSQAFFSRDQQRLYVIHPRDSRIAVIDTDPESPTHHEQIELIEAPGVAWRMCFNPETTLAWVLIESWELALLDTNPDSLRYHTFVERRPIESSCRFLLRAVPGERMSLCLFDDSHGVVRVFEPSTR